MRGDMGGAACVLASILTAAKLELPVHIKGFIPLAENMPSGTAIKPGDVVTALNGKTIQIDNTDAEGRLILADALAYAQKKFQPKLVLDVATLTGAINVALGSSAAGVFTNSNALWNLIQQSSFSSGDRLWRMPLWKHFNQALSKSSDHWFLLRSFVIFTHLICSFWAFLESQLADLNNIGMSGAGGSCTAAAFLHVSIWFYFKNNFPYYIPITYLLWISQEFTDAPHWMHLDIAGVSGVVDGSAPSYFSKGLSFFLSLFTHLN